MKRLPFLALLLMTTTTLQAQIDLHSHIITPEYLAALEQRNALMDEGFPIPSWEAERHLDFMNRAGVTTAVLTMPAPQPWFGDAALEQYGIYQMIGWKDLGHVLGAGKEEEARKLGAS